MNETVTSVIGLGHRAVCRNFASLITAHSAPFTSFSPFSPPSSLAQRLFQEPPAKSKFLAVVDGSWWDYPLYDYHQAYGTGYSLMALAWCRDAIAAGG